MYVFGPGNNRDWQLAASKVSETGLAFDGVQPGNFIEASFEVVRSALSLAELPVELRSGHYFEGGADTAFSNGIALGL